MSMLPPQTITLLFSTAEYPAMMSQTWLVGCASSSLPELVHRALRFNFTDSQSPQAFFLDRWKGGVQPVGHHVA
ncbi:hypothetical protein VI03_14315 [Burkholderia vietnamiensis]|nr:hypothetical protein VI03_14315 [Burkholderia vietnamiensis]